MSINEFLKKLNASETIDFEETMAVIAEHYQYHPAHFQNGLNADVLNNPAGSNEGSCKIFSFARINHLNNDQTLKLFGNYYRIDVLENPEGKDHMNIRNFIRFGWKGISFSSDALTLKEQ